MSKAAVKEKRDVYQEVTDRVIEALEQGTVPWRKPWTGGGMALSLSSKKPYRGINPWLLDLAATEGGYSSPWWGTYNKIKEMDGEVRRGEHGTRVVLWKRFTPKPKPGETDDPKPVMMLRQYTVFNAEQAYWPEDSAPLYDIDERTAPERIEAAEAIVKGYVSGPNGPALHERVSDGCYYVPSTDSITVPALAQFTEAEEFYSSLFHEIVHSTGHKTRNNRPDIQTFGHFGDNSYSKEELCAEFGAAMLCGVAGIANDATIENSGAYLRSWLSKLRDDKKLLVHAAAQAQKAADRVLGTTFEEEKDNAE